MTRGGATREFAVSFIDENGIARTETVVAFDREQAAAALRHARPLCTEISCGESGGGQAVS